MISEDTIERDEVARKNRDALVALMAAHSLWIPASDFANWRPTVRQHGDISGVASDLTIIATNGLLAYFSDATGSVFCGHIQCFSGEVKPLFSTQKDKAKTIKPAKTKSPRKSRLELALELLAKL